MGDKARLQLLGCIYFVDTEHGAMMIFPRSMGELHAVTGSLGSTSETRLARPPRTGNNEQLLPVTNPYSLSKQWSPEVLEAYKDMPKSRGYTVSLFSCHPNDLDRLEDEWKAWLKRHPKRLWPTWVSQWAEYRKRVPRKSIPVNRGVDVPSSD